MMLMQGYVSDRMLVTSDLYDSSLAPGQARDALLQHYTSPHKRLNPAVANQPAQFTVYPHKQDPLLHWLAAGIVGFCRSHSRSH